VKPISNVPVDLTGALDPAALPSLDLDDRFVAMAALLQTGYRRDNPTFFAELRQYRNKYPDDLGCLYYVATDLLEHRWAYDAIIQLVEEWLPTLSTDRAWQCRLLKVSGLARLRGWFRESRSQTELFDKAKQDLSRAAQLDAAISEAYAHLAVVFAVEGRVTEVGSALERAVETSANADMTATLAGIRTQLRKDPAADVSRLRDFYN